MVVQGAGWLKSQRAHVSAKMAFPRDGVRLLRLAIELGDQRVCLGQVCAPDEDAVGRPVVEEFRDVLQPVLDHTEVVTVPAALAIMSNGVHADTYDASMSTRRSVM